MVPEGAQHSQDMAAYAPICEKSHAPNLRMGSGQECPAQSSVSTPVHGADHRSKHRKPQSDQTFAGLCHDPAMKTVHKVFIEPIPHLYPATGRARDRSRRCRNQRASGSGGLQCTLPSAINNDSSQAELNIPPRPYLREYGARCLAASDKLTSWFAGSQAQPIASEECALWRRQRSLFAEKLAVHLITIGLHT